MEKQNVRITVATVCYQSEATLEKTVTSVLSQNANGFEYLIVDGASKDGTAQIAQRYKEDFARKGIAYRIVSEPDNGIYDAMNKAARLAEGTYILYLNADDCLCGEDVLAQVLSQMDAHPDFDVYYGDRIISDHDMYKYSKARPTDTFKKTMPFCHQSAFTRTQLLRERPYDLSFRLFADHDFYLWCWLKGRTFFQMPLAVAVYVIGGFSGRAGYEKQMREHYGIHLKNGLIDRAEYDENVKKLKLRSVPHDVKKWLHTRVPACLMRPLMKKKGFRPTVSEALEKRS